MSNRKTRPTFSQSIFSVINLFGFVLLMFTMFVYADSQQIVDYEYDSAGNITSIRALNFSAPPDVTNLSPGFVNQDGLSFIKATGINLFKAEVTTNEPGLSISNVNHISGNEIRFTLVADETAVPGVASLTFTTRLGSDTETVVIADRTPVISTDPNPVLLELNNIPEQVTLLFDQAFSTDQVFDILIQDTAIASVDAQSITLLAGEREASINMTGIGVGITNLEVNQFSNLLALSVPVIVTDPFQLPTGNLYVSSKPFGVNVARNELPVGQNQALSRALGVTTTNLQLPIGNNQVFSTALGVTLEPVAEQISPSQVVRGTTATLTITGVSLNVITNVSFNPDTGITQTAPFSANATGTELSVFIDVAAIAATGLRQIILNGPNGPINFSMPNGSIFEITN